MRPHGPQTSRENAGRIQLLVDDLHEASTTHWTFVPWPLIDLDRDEDVSWASQGMQALPEIEAWVEDYYERHDLGQANDPQGLQPRNGYDAEPGRPSSELQRALVAAGPDCSSFWLCPWQVKVHFDDPPTDQSREALVIFRDRGYVPTEVSPEEVPNPDREVLLVHGDGAWLVAVGLAAFGTLPGDLVLSRAPVDQLLSPDTHDLIPAGPEDPIR